MEIKKEFIEPTLIEVALDAQDIICFSGETSDYVEGGVDED